MIFETHVHFDDEAFNDDRDTAIKRAKEAGVDKIINIGADLISSRKSIELAKRFDYVYTSVGVHPSDVTTLKESDLELIIAMCAYEKVVAIGEIGLDYHYEKFNKAVQKLWFREQLTIAKNLELPVVIHSRDAAEDTYRILSEYELDGVLHCYSYSLEMAKKFIDLGYKIGVGGVVTFSNAKKLIEVVKGIDLKDIILETDAPYLAPTPFRGKRNESSYLTYVVDEIAKIKGVDKEVVEEITYNNSMKLFGLS